MTPHELIIRRLCQDDFTRHEAKRLYTTASQRTGKNTGYDLGAGHGALAQICAFLASESTGAREVTEEQARSSACLDTKTFDAALQVVRRAALKSSALDPKRVTYDHLVRQYQIREDANVAMLEVLQAFRASEALDNSQLTPESPVVQCAIFYWVCTNVFELDVPGHPVFQARHKFSERAWFLILRLLKRHCGHMVKKLAAHAKTATPSARTRSQTRTRTPQSAPARPSDSKHTLDSITPRKASVVRSMKGKVRKEPPIDAREDETPSKRQKSAMYVPSPLGKDQSVRTPKAVRGDAAATAVTPSRKGRQEPVVGLEDESEDDSTGTIVVQPKKNPSRSADTAAWEAERPKLQSTPTQASSFENNVSSNNIDAINSTPMTSTGMSDVFSDSPSSTHPPRQLIRARFRSPSPAAMSSASDDEMPRLRRRNLRAPFLDKEAYCWNPSARTKEWLERGRRLEALMISKFGDKWDDL